MSDVGRKDGSKGGGGSQTSGGGNKPQSSKDPTQKINPKNG